MDADKRRSEDYLRDETYQIIGYAMKVLNSVGHGFHEKTYENGLVVDFRNHSIPYEQQPRYPIEYEGKEIATFIPDLVVFRKIIVDT